MLVCPRLHQLDSLWNRRIARGRLCIGNGPVCPALDMRTSPCHRQLVDTLWTPNVSAIYRFQHQHHRHVHAELWAWAIPEPHAPGCLAFLSTVNYVLTSQPFPCVPSYNCHCPQPARSIGNTVFAGPARTRSFRGNWWRAQDSSCSINSRDNQLIDRWMLCERIGESETHDMYIQVNECIYK